MVKVGWSFHALFGVSRKCPTAANSACIICASPRCQSATGLTPTQNEGGQRIQSWVELTKPLSASVVIPGMARSRKPTSRVKALSRQPAADRW